MSFIDDAREAAARKVESDRQARAEQQRADADRQAEMKRLRCDHAQKLATKQLYQWFIDMGGEWPRTLDETPHLKYVSESESMRLDDDGGVEATFAWFDSGIHFDATYSIRYTTARPDPELLVPDGEVWTTRSQNIKPRFTVAATVKGLWVPIQTKEDLVHALEIEFDKSD